MRERTRGIVDELKQRRPFHTGCALLDQLESAVHEANALVTVGLPGQRDQQRLNELLARLREGFR